MVWEPRQLIYLLTPQHTGTHFARLLLETHPQISFGIAESRRIDRQLRVDYRLFGNGVGRQGPDNEVMLDDLAVECLEGGMTPEDFVRRVTYCRTQYSQTAGTRTMEAEFARMSLRMFHELDLNPAEKTPRYLLFHGHCGPKHAQARFQQMPFQYVVTLRHPLLSVISSLRRTNDEHAARNILVAFDTVLRIEKARFLCIDLPDRQASDCRRIFASLELSWEPLTERYLQLAPRINRTIETERQASPLEERETLRCSLEMLESLREARRMLVDDGRIHPVLTPWVKLARELNLPERLRIYGYNL